MVWTYTGNPVTDAKDAVRFEIGDTDKEDPLLQDEEIVYAISVEANVLAAAARCCESISRYFARQADFRLGPQAVQASQRSLAYKELARDLRRRSASGLYAGGADKEEHLKDSHLKRPAFKRNLMSIEGEEKQWIDK